MAPFVAALCVKADVRIIVYVRDPRDWLPSAYQQWAVYHKTTNGPIPPYRERARVLIGQYRWLRLWNESFGDNLTVRVFHRSRDVVMDFASLLDIQIEFPRKRSLERIGISEALLRAYYNASHEEKCHPNEFTEALKHVTLAATPSIDQLVRDSFSYAETDRIIADFSDIFDYVEDAFGINLLADPPPVRELVDSASLRKRALEHLLSITLHQADQIRALELKVEKLMKAMLNISAK